MHRRLVLRGSAIGGYGLPGGLAAVGVLGSINAFLARIWLDQAALTVWVIIVGGAVVVIFFAEAVSRRNVVEVKDDRIRWSLRQPPDKGDQPFSDLQSVELYPSGARLVFKEGYVVADGVAFRLRDIRRWVKRLHQLGVPVSEQPTVH